MFFLEFFILTMVGVDVVVQDVVVADVVGRFGGGYPMLVELKVVNKGWEALHDGGGNVVNWCKDSEGNPKADAYGTVLDCLQCVPLLLCGVGEGNVAIFENRSDVSVVYT